MCTRTGVYATALGVVFCPHMAYSEGMATRRNRNSSRYLGTITKTELDQAAASDPVPYRADAWVNPSAERVEDWLVLTPAEQAEVDAYPARVAATEAKMAWLGLFNWFELADFEAKMERKDRQLAAEAKIANGTWMGAR